MFSALQELDARIKRFDLSERLFRRNPLYYDSVQRELLALRDAPLAERIAWTRARLARLLESARSTSYAHSVKDCASVDEWPCLSKEAVRDNPAAFRTRAWFSARAYTSGTTGAPLKLARSPEAVVVEQACIDQLIQSMGAEPRAARVAVLRGDNIKNPSDQTPPFWIRALSGRRLILSSNHLTEHTLEHYCDALADFRPDVLWVYPTSLESLCRLLTRRNMRLSIPRVLSSSEMLHPQVWRLARSLLGCDIIDYYGQAERVAFAHAARMGEWFFLPGYAYVELAPHSIDGGILRCEIIGTSLWNHAMPLVRYRTGDLVWVSGRPTAQELLEIAHGARPFHGVIGRSRDVLLAPDGGGVLTGIDHIPRGVDCVLRLQVVQDALDHVTLRVLAGARFSEEHARQLIANARRKIPETMVIAVEVVDGLQRSACGKTPFIVHAPEVQAAFRAAGFEALH